MRTLSIFLLSLLLFSCRNKPHGTDSFIKPDVQKTNIQSRFSKSDFLYLVRKTADSVRKEWSLSIEDITFYVSPKDTIIQVNDRKSFYQNKYFRTRIVANFNSYEPYAKVIIDIYADTSINSVSMLEEEIKTIQEDQQSLDFRARTIQLYHFLFVLELNKDFSWSVNLLNRLEILLQRLFIDYMYRKANLLD